MALRRSRSRDFQDQSFGIKSAITRNFLKGGIAFDERSAFHRRAHEAYGEERLNPRRAACDDRKGSRGRDGGGGGIAHRLESFLVPCGPFEIRKRSARFSKFLRHRNRFLIDAFHELGSHRERGFRIVGNSHPYKRFGKSHDAKPDAPVGQSFLADLIQRVFACVDHVVQKAHGISNGLSQFFPVGGRLRDFASEEMGQVQAP